MITLTLGALVCSSVKPQRLYLIDESDQAITRNLQVVKAIDLLSVMGVDVEYHRRIRSKGCSMVRQFSLGLVKEDWALMLDDDVFVTPSAIGMLIDQADAKVPYVGGCKVELNNDKGYSDHTLTPRAVDNSVEPFYLYSDDVTMPIMKGDYGFMLMNMKMYREAKIDWHDYDPNERGIPGSDRWVTEKLSKLYGHGLLRTGAVAWHLEGKPYRFNVKGLMEEYRCLK